ncbi:MULTISPECIES: bacterio-opsin activator domain-containing protein [Halomicrobium]|uniref:PAS domain S-box protein n=2 Tax=Halomicrobium mukohataei TaxID=57705 RepID=A0A4D6KFC0_9EURY|nr:MULTISPECIES: bacterio-opsin activator domain-containing protein [Halomicrobium]ACV46162.1 putative PAS/PAC sensor protein [Halomicrobium mukohataei DSM 12286]QCD64731.1 PAS domain S-box protein [Halomicrobium mukohataei]QFR19538.1 PAS domain S-box protein [Halomicrobium sp. ZPS1]
MTGETGSGSETSDGKRVLYVDTPTDSVADRLAARLADCRLHHETGVEAVTAAESESWDGLVVTDGIEADRRSALLDAVDCPSVLYASADPATIPAETTRRVETIVERETADAASLLAEKIETLVGQFPDAFEDARGSALSTICREVTEGSALFAVDDEGRVRWSNHSFEALFPVDRIERSIPETEDFYARLDAIVSAEPDDGGRRDIGPRDGPVENHSVVVATPTGTRYYVHQRHRLESVGDGITIEQFEDITDRVRRETRRRLLALLVEQARDGLYTLDHNGVVDFCNESFAAMLGYERGELIGMHASEMLAPGELVAGQRTVQALLDDPDTDGAEVDMTFRTRDGEDRELSIHYTLLSTGGDSYGGLMGVARDVTERRERTRRIESQRDELSTLSRTNVLVQDIIGALGTAASTIELRQTVCDRLVESGRYGLAWIGERHGGDDVIVPLTSAGAWTEHLDDVELRADDGADAAPVARAYRTGEVQVVSDTRSLAAFSPRPERAPAAGFEAVIVTPLCHGETTHGILAVYATEPDAFSERIARSFAVLGETIGLALTAIQNKRLLQHEAPLRLAFRSDSDDACLVRVARSCDCTLETAGVVETSDGVVQYLRVDGAAPSTVVDTVCESELVDDAAVTRTDGDSLVELHGPSSPGTELAEVGARLVETEIDPGGARLVVETTGDADLRSVQTVVERWFPDVTLVSKRKRTQPESDGERSPLSPLTDRQREVLRAAYLSGYYDWPRETTAEELADSLGIASPTLHQHLRRAERNLLAGVLDR